jgi:hypothetical protein
MLISHKYKFITIDIPKTGSCSLRESLVPLDIIDIIGEPNVNAVFYQHGTAAECKNSLSNIDLNFNNYYSICFTRNPWGRYFSFFKYCKNKSEQFKAQKNLLTEWSNHKIIQGKYWASIFDQQSDKEIFKNIILDNSSQDTFYYDKNRAIMVNHVADFENLQSEFASFCDKIDINTPKLKHDNQSYSAFSMHDFYDQELIDLVAEKEAGVIELKGYDYIA